MRRFVDITVLIAVLIAGVVVLSPRSSSRDPHEAVDHVQRSLAALYDRASYHGALDDAPSQTRTLWPVAVLPEWFPGELPANVLLPDVEATRSHLVSETPTRPWIDVAPPGDMAVHPPDPVAVRREQAQFWYNPAVGVFRARVSASLGEDAALSLYNHANGVELKGMPFDTDPRRTPLTYTPDSGQRPALTQAMPQDDAGYNASKQAGSMFNPAPEATDAAPRPARRPTMRDMTRE